MITGISGVRVGHWSDTTARTGCTVVLLPAGTVASGEMRGSAPASREWALLEPGRLVQRVDAVVLTGGSAFGLAACDGVMRWCEERGVGFPTGAGPVPIVVGLALYDLGVGDSRVRPGPDEGYAACVAATAGEVTSGAVGAATGATVGHAHRDEGGARAGAMGTASASDGDVTVAALVALNPFGDLRDGTPKPWAPPVSPFANTTIGVVATDARLDKLGCRHVAAGGHDAYARALEPVHTSFDGDAVVACATGLVDAHPDRVRVLGAAAMESAIRSALSAPNLRQ